MTGSPSSPLAAAQAWWRRVTAGAPHALSPRGALALHQVDGALVFGLRSAAAMALPALPLVAAGRTQLAVAAMLGSFTTTFGRNLPYARRTWVLALVAVAMTACVGLGAALAVAAHPRDGGLGAVAVVAATAVVAGLAKLGCDAARLSGLGAVLLLFAFAVEANAAPTSGDVLPLTAMAAVGASVAWALAVVGALVHPDRPQRLAVAAALRAVAALLEALAEDVPTRAVRHRATVAVLQAYRSLGLSPRTDARQSATSENSLERLADLSWSLLVGSARQQPANTPTATGHLREQARLLTDRRRELPPVLPELARLDPAARRAAARSNPHANPHTDPHMDPPPGSPGAPATGRVAELALGRQPGTPGRLWVAAVPALRMTLGTGLAGGLALALGLGHGYWAAISAAAVLHSVNLRTTAQRAVQRTLGTLAGLGLAVAVLAAGPGPMVLAVVVVLMEFLLEYVVVRNYALGVVFVTPLALLMSDLAAPTSTEDLILDRGLGSLLGIGVGLLCALLVVHDRAAVRVERALAACREAADRAERSLAARALPRHLAQVRLADAVVELREADDAAAGELLQAGVDPAALAAEEQRAYLLLDRLLHGD